LSDNERMKLIHLPGQLFMYLVMLLNKSALL